MCLATMGRLSHDNPTVQVNVPRFLHLADLNAGNLTLCCLPLSDVSIGQYWEYLDECPDGELKFKRTICAGDWQVWQSCPECLSLRPPVLCSVDAPS